MQHSQSAKPAYSERLTSFFHALVVIMMAGMTLGALLAGAHALA